MAFAAQHQLWLECTLCKNLGNRSQTLSAMAHNPTEPTINNSHMYVIDVLPVFMNTQPYECKSHRHVCGWGLTCVCMVHSHTLAHARPKSCTCKLCNKTGTESPSMSIQSWFWHQNIICGMSKCWSCVFAWFEFWASGASFMPTVGMSA